MNTVLRSVDETDLPTIRQWRRDRSLRNLTHGFRYPSNDVMERAWFENKVLHGAPEHAVFAIQSELNEAIGLAQLSPIDPLHRNAKLGIYIAENPARGNGTGERALHELLEFGFHDLNLHKIFLEVTADNHPAIALYEKTGFTREGCLRDHYWVNGSSRDVVIMALFAADYAKD